jgi:hypothetical protein
MNLKFLKKPIYISSALVLCTSSLLLGAFDKEKSLVSAAPIIHDSRFKIEKFAEFDLKPLRSFGMAISDGTNGFSKGLFVSTGPLPDRDRLLFIDPLGNISVFKDGLVSNEGLIFAEGSYGNGLFVGEIAQGRILRLQSDGSASVFSTGFSQPIPNSISLGPAQLTYGPDPKGIYEQVLYASDFSSGNILRVNPDGSTELFASLASLPLLRKAAAFQCAKCYTSNFNFNSNPGTGTISSVALNGTSQNLISGLEGLQLMTAAPGGTFGNGIYVASEGLAPIVANNDGGVFILEQNGNSLQPFVTGIDASQVVFDTQNILGGGMFISDFNEALSPDKLNTIWRVTPTSGNIVYSNPCVPEPSTVLGTLALGTLGAASTLKRKLKPSQSTEKETTKVS